MKVAYSYWQIFYDPDIPLAERIGWAAVSPVAIPVALLGSLGGCTSQPQFGNAVFIPSGTDAGSGDISATNDGHTPDALATDVAQDSIGHDVFIGSDGDAAEISAPDVFVSDTPIDVPPQPKLCSSQVTLPPNANITTLIAGETASCATTKEGTLKCWGKFRNEYLGKLITTFDSPTPKAMDGFKNIAQASLYLQHLCARDNFGNAWCMGQNAWGQLGDGKKYNGSATAVQVQGAANIMQVAAGGFHSCAVDTAGAVYCWGYNVNGQVGLGDTAASSITTAQKVIFTPPTPISTIALGSFHSSAIHESGAIFGWGHNGVKQLGLTTAGNKVYAPMFVDKSGYRVAAGDDFSCLIDKECAVSCTGSGEMGQLGNGTKESKSALTPIKSLKDISLIAANRQYACAATQSGALYCWGRSVKLVKNEIGEQVDKELFASPSPILINGIGPVAQLAVGANHACAIDNTGAVYCWGDNAAGQLGDGGTTASTTPVKVIGL